MKNTEKDLQLQFELLGLSLEDWGRGETKTLEHLAKEVDRGECQINGIFREIHTVVMDVVCGKEKLREVCQAFEDGRIRQRTLPWGSVGEKLRIGEQPIFGLWRALKEELRIDLDREIRVGYLGEVSFISRSTSYPGLVTKNIQVRFLVKLPKRLYRPGGYFENQSDKTTYFDWVPRTVE